MPIAIITGRSVKGSDSAFPVDQHIPLRAAAVGARDAKYNLEVMLSGDVGKS